MPKEMKCNEVVAPEVQPGLFAFTAASCGCCVLPLEHNVRKQKHSLGSKQARIHKGERAAADGGRDDGLLQITEGSAHAALRRRVRELGAAGSRQD